MNPIEGLYINNLYGGESMKGILKGSSKFLCFAIFFTSLCVAFFAQTANATSNLITNGGLESGNASGWTGYGSWSVVNNNAYSGTYSARIQSGSAFEQVILVLQHEFIFI